MHVLQEYIVNIYNVELSCELFPTILIIVVGQWALLIPMNNWAHSKTGTTFTVKFTLLHTIILKNALPNIKLSLVMNDHSFVIKVATTLWKYATTTLLSFKLSHNHISL